MIYWERKYTVLFFLLIFLSLNFSLKAKNPVLELKSPPASQKNVTAYRITAPINVDGILSENVWQKKGFDDFIQSDPIDGGEPTEKTVVWVVYDDKSLYLAARLYDSLPDKITSRLGRRDDFVESDWFIVAVDPYYDRRSGYKFAVNPSGSICDWTLFNDVNEDSTWDGIWEWAARIDENGWTVEIRIPFDQLRFPQKEEYIWGVNFERKIQRKHERNTFVWVPKDDIGYVSRFARLVGLNGIKSGHHIELWPYTTGQAHFSPEVPGNPFQTGRDFLGNAGADLKIGLMGNLTLDATINPDFGQVEVDPAVINLTAFETYYQEKRPFFIEGNTIFREFGMGGMVYNVNINFPIPTFFYSRRIGRSPQGYVTEEGYTRIPDRSTILGAFKLSGKMVEGWNMSFVGALTSREYAEIENSGKRYRQEVEPFTYYGVLRSLKEFNEGQQGFGFLVTSVIRDLRSESLSGILNDKAFSLAFDGWSYLDKDRTWILSGWMGGTYIHGSPDAVLKLQQSSLHYFQRPDASHLKLNKNAASLHGWGGRFQLSKQRGRTIINFALGALSPGFDPNDAGFQHGGSDIINSCIVFGYLWPYPTKITREAIASVGTFRSYDFGGNKNWEGYIFMAQGMFINYWGFSTILVYNPESLSKDLTRGGPMVKIPYGYEVGLDLSTDRRNAVIFNLSAGHYGRPVTGTKMLSGSFGIRWKPCSNISFSITPEYLERKTEYQWIRKVDDPLMTETFETRYVFGRLFQRVLSTEIRLNWIFTPKLSLQAYIQPFLAVGAYSRFKELTRPKSWDYKVYAENGGVVDFSDNVYTVDPDGEGPAQSFAFNNPDFNFKSIRGTIVLRWEYHPGSILYIVWTQNRQDFAHPGDFSFRRDVTDLFSAPGDNIFLFKITYRWNM